MKELVWIQIRKLSKAAGKLMHHIFVGAPECLGAIVSPTCYQSYRQAFASYWPVVERDKVARVAIEITIAVLVTICLNPCRHDFS